MPNIYSIKLFIVLWIKKYKSFCFMFEGIIPHFCHILQDKRKKMINFLEKTIIESTTWCNACFLSISLHKIYVFCDWNRISQLSLENINTPASLGTRRCVVIPNFNFHNSQSLSTLPERKDFLIIIWNEFKNCGCYLFSCFQNPNKCQFSGFF